MISFKQLSYALAAAETLHFKKASEKCNISQSALSTALNELEKQLGLKIFERNNKQVLITPAGKKIIYQARQILLQVDELAHFAETHKAPLSFPLSMGIIPTIAPFIIPKLLPILKQDYPTAQLNIEENQSHVLVDMVRNGELDTAIIALPFPTTGLLTLKFWEEDFFWITLKGNKYSQQKGINSHEIKQCNLLLLKEGHCLKDHIISVCNMLDKTSKQEFCATSINTLIQMVAGDLGSTLVPAMAVEQLTSQHKSLSVIHLDEPGPHRELVFIFRPNFTRTSSIEALVEVCKKALENLH